MKKFLATVAAAMLLTVSVSAQDGTMMKSDKSGSADGTMMKSSSAGSSMMVSDADRKLSADPMDVSAYNLKGLGKQVVAFTTEAAAQELAQKQTVVYYFAATWCPDCQQTYRDLKVNFAKIPPNFTLVFVNYDKARDLKKKYGITSQHTFVLLGSMGEKKKIWSGSTTVADLVRTATM